jgi:hypothetical protein
MLIISHATHVYNGRASPRRPSFLSSFPSQAKSRSAWRVHAETQLTDYVCIWRYCSIFRSAGREVSDSTWQNQCSHAEKPSSSDSASCHIGSTLPCVQRQHGVLAPQCRHGDTQFCTSIQTDLQYIHTVSLQVQVPAASKAPHTSILPLSPTRKSTAHQPPTRACGRACADV